MSNIAKALLWAGATSIVVLLASFCWELFYVPAHPSHASWIVLPSGVRCPLPPPHPLSVLFAWLFSAVRAAQTFVIVFAIVLIVSDRRSNR
jgi:hypothetical protein